MGEIHTFLFGRYVQDDDYSKTDKSLLFFEYDCSRAFVNVGDIIEFTEGIKACPYPRFNTVVYTNETAYPMRPFRVEGTIKLSTDDDNFVNYYGSNTDNGVYEYCVDTLQLNSWEKISQFDFYVNQLLNYNYDSEDLKVCAILFKEQRVAYWYKNIYYNNYEELEYAIKQAHITKSPSSAHIELSNIQSAEIEVVPDAPPISKSTFSSKINIKEDKSMEVTSIFDKYHFGKVPTSLGSSPIAYSPKGLAFRDLAGEYVVYENGNGTNVSNMVIDVPIYIMPVSLSSIKPNDIIVRYGADNEAYVIVEEVKPNGIVVIEPRDKERRELIPERSIFGFDFVAKVVTPFEMMNTNASADNPFGNMLPFMFMNDSKRDNSMMNTLLMCQLAGGNTDFTSNSLMLFALMGEEKNGDMLPFLIMSGAFNQLQTTTNNLRAVIRNEIENYIDETTED